MKTRFLKMSSQGETFPEYLSPEINIKNFQSFGSFPHFFSYIIVMDVVAFWDRVKVLIRAHNVDQKKFSAHLSMPFGTLKG